MKKNNAWFKRLQALLEKMLDAWKPQAKAKGYRWNPPGMFNGLMAEFLGEALELGAITIHNPSDLEEVEKVGKSIASWLNACEVDSFPVKATFEEGTLHVSVGSATPNNYSLKVTSAKIE